MSTVLAMSHHSNANANLEIQTGRPLICERHNILVKFDIDENQRGVFQYSVDGGPLLDNLTLEVTADQVVLAFYLDPAASPAAQFTRQAFTFVKFVGCRLEPIPQPSNFQTMSEMHVCSLVDTNLLPSAPLVNPGMEQVYGFFLTVLCGDQLYSSTDPTIINKEPPPT